MTLNSTWSALEESYNRFNGISFEGSMNAIADGNTLTFTLVEDKMPPRPKSFAVPWHRVE